MTRFEYDNTIRDLLGDDTHPAAEFGAEEEALGFNNNAQALSTSSALVDKHFAAASGIAARLTSNLGRLTWYSCAPATQGDRVCAEQFLKAFGARAYRRPLTAEEEAELFAIYDRGATIGGLDGTTPLTPFVAGLRLAVESVLISPDFLYRVELPAPSPDAGVPVRLDSHALASRLSYLLWASQPDEALKLAADKGELSTPEQVRAAARRMLLDPRARAVVSEFHQQWLDFDRIANVGKAASVYPRWSTAHAGSMHAETRAFVEHVVFDGEGTYDALLTAPYTFVDARLAELYGLPAPMGGAAMNKVPLDPKQRGGLLTQGSLLTLNAHSNQTSPVHRGKLVREAFLCEVLAAPPPEVMITVPEPNPNSTARERFREHSDNAACSACHRLMDPLGFGFESFDGIGVHRDTEANLPIDASGHIYGTDVAGPFTGVPGLAKKLSLSAQARRCYVKQWFRFAHGRGEQAADACTLERLEKSFTEDGRDVKKLLEEITQSDAFLYAGGAP
ncbi:MAG: DUF1592 domain-containing protein [Myxococcaceae bacterium]|nr:DUF1592 domain-containing protein [Myxococcaceae bacterium]